MENLHEADGGLPVFVTVRKFAEISGLSCYTIKKLLREDALPSLRRGKIRFVPREAGLRALERLACENMDGGDDD